MKTEAVTKDITDDILCKIDNNFVVHLQVHQVAECHDDYVFIHRPPKQKCIVKICSLSQTPYMCIVAYFSKYYVL